LTNTKPDAIELWVVDVAEARARKLIDRPLNLAAILRGFDPSPMRKFATTCTSRPGPGRVSRNDWPPSASGSAA
jgi:hypothetical protein